MHQIISLPTPPTPIFRRLLLGTLWYAGHLDEVAAAGLQHPPLGLVVNCTDEALPRRRNAVTVQLGLQDGFEVPYEKLQYAARAVKQFFEVDYDRAVLICCHAAQSRSPAIMLTYLLSIGMGFDEAYGMIRRKHPRMHIAPAILKSVRQCFGYAPRSVDDLIA